MTLFNQSTVDDRTVDDQLSDLGVPVERPHPAKNLEAEAWGEVMRAINRKRRWRA
jgi:hypothetical protein